MSLVCLTVTYQSPLATYRRTQAGTVVALAGLATRPRMSDMVSAATLPIQWAGTFRAAPAFLMALQWALDGRRIELARVP